METSLPPAPSALPALPALPAKPAMPDDACALLAAHPLFASVDRALIRETAAAGHRARFGTGETLTALSDTPSLCVILSGSASVYSRETGGDLLLRVLRAGDIFGAATLFADARPVSHIVADTPCVTLFLPEDAVRALLTKEPAFALSYIGFLSDRVRFLNRRIACLGAGSASARLCAYLAGFLPEGGGDDVPVTFTLPLPMNRLSDVLGLGRASLYRAFDELCGAGLLSRDGRSVTVGSPAALRRACGPG